MRIEMHAANAASHMHMLRAYVLMYANNGCDLRLITTADYNGQVLRRRDGGTNREHKYRTGRDPRTGDEK